MEAIGGLGVRKHQSVKDMTVVLKTREADLPYSLKAGPVAFLNLAPQILLDIYLPFRKILDNPLKKNRRRKM